MKRSLAGPLLVCATILAAPTLSAAQTTHHADSAAGQASTPMGQQQGMGMSNSAPGNGRTPTPGMMGPQMMGPQMMGMTGGAGMGPGMMMGPQMMRMMHGAGMMGPQTMGMMPCGGAAMSSGMMGSQGMGAMPGGGMGRGMMGPQMMGMMRGQPMGNAPFLSRFGTARMAGPGAGGGLGVVVPSRRVSVEDVRDHFRNWLELSGNPRLKVGKVETADDDGRIVAEIVTTDGALVDRLTVDARTGVIQRDR